MTKQMTMTEAIQRFVPDGTSIALGATPNAMVPFAAGHEIIRQERRGLTLIGTHADILFDQLVGAGCVDIVMTPWMGNTDGEPGHALRRAIEQGIPKPIDVRDHSLLSLTLALLAGGLGSPFIPTLSLLGTDLPNTNPDLIESVNPLNERGDPIILVRAFQPDIAIFHVPQADEQGHTTLQEPLGLASEIALAAKAILLVAEQIVPTDALPQTSMSAIIPAHKVVAVVEEPGGAHPSAVPTFYEHDSSYTEAYAQQTQTEETFEQWLETWVMDVADRLTYLEQLGVEQWAALSSPNGAEH